MISCSLGLGLGLSSEICLIKYLYAVPSIRLPDYSDPDLAFSAEEKTCSALDCLPINRTTSEENNFLEVSETMGEMLGINPEMQGEVQNLSWSVRCGTVQ